MSQCVVVCVVVRRHAFTSRHLLCESVAVCFVLCRSVLQCVVVCCNVSQCVAVLVAVRVAVRVALRVAVRRYDLTSHRLSCEFVAFVCRNVLQCVSQCVVVCVAVCFAVFILQAPPNLHPFVWRV